MLCRTNARLADFEEPLHEAKIPFQGAALLAREAARQLLKQLRQARHDRRGRDRASATPETPAGASGCRRSSASGRWFASRISGASLGWRRSSTTVQRTTREFIADLEARFGSTGADRRGVHLLTLHGAKGLEFEAVFIPRLEEKELPIRQAKKPDEIAEERRLFYVGLTRAKRHSRLTWSGKPSRFLAELGIAAAPARKCGRPSPTIRSTRH